VMLSLVWVALHLLFWLFSGIRGNQCLWLGVLWQVIYVGQEQGRPHDCSLWNSRNDIS
jgi:hypothetical protein